MCTACALTIVQDDHKGNFPAETFSLKAFTHLRILAKSTHKLALVLKSMCLANRNLHHFWPISSYVTVVHQNLDVQFICRSIEHSCLIACKIELGGDHLLRSKDTFQSLMKRAKSMYFRLSLAF